LADQKLVNGWKIKLFYGLLAVTRSKANALQQGRIRLVPGSVLPRYGLLFLNKGFRIFFSCFLGYNYKLVSNFFALLQNKSANKINPRLSYQTLCT
jgi:hypothetical protein